jgi:hypothetical protein
MKFTSLGRRSAVAATLAVLFLSFSAFADTIRLKDGGIIKGRIVRFSGGSFTIVVGEGSREREVTFTSDEVSTIQFDRQSTPGQNNTARYPSTVRRDPPVINANAGTRTTAQRRVPDDADAVEVEETVAKPTVQTKPAPARIENKPTPSVVKTSPITQPVSLSVKVLADNTSNGWTNSGWVVRKGQRVKISGDGKVSLGGGKTSTPSGDPQINDDQKLLKGVATGALIAVIGDDNNDFMYIGAEREFTAERDGTLFLGVNEGNLNDNTGNYDVKIEIRPEGM